jgi:sugar phosphate permease
MLVGSQWYTRSEQAPRFSFWYSGLGVAQIIGGLVSFGFQYIGPGAALSGWRTMFVVLGVVTSLFGALAGWIVPDSPMATGWLSRGEKLALLNHVAENRTGVANRHFKIAQVWELLLDPQIYLLTVITVLVSSCRAGICGVAHDATWISFGHGKALT